MSTPTPDPNQNPAAQVAASQAQQPPATPAQEPTAAPTAQPTPNPYASARPLTAPADQQTPNNDHVAMFDRILRMVNPGQTYVDPTGKQQTINNKPSLGRAVMASVLAGMMTPTVYRQGAYGPVVSGDVTAAEAYGAGKEQQTAQNTKLQATSDEIQTKKLSVLKNNIDAMHQYAALAQQQHQELQGVADRNNATILKDLSDYDSKQDDPSEKLIRGKGLTLEQAMAMTKGKMSSQNMVIDGYQDVTDADGHTSVQPTFAVINPDAKINMSEASAAELAKYKPAYKNAYDLTGGNIKIPVGQYLSDVHLANSAANLDDFMKRNDDALQKLGIQSGDVDVAAASRNNPRVRQSIVEAENALAQGGEMYQVLDRLQKSPDGSTLLAAMGINPDKAARYVTERTNAATAEQTKATAGAKDIDKLPAPPALVTSFPADIKKSYPSLTSGQIDSLTKQLGSNPTQKDYKGIQDRAEKYDTANTARQTKGTEQADKGQETMWKSGINPVTKERLSVDNAPDEFMVNTRTGNPIPKDMLTTLKPTMQESNRADFAKSAIHSLDKLNDLLDSSEAKFGPISGPVDKWMAGHGLGDEYEQAALNYLTFAQSAATGAHVGGRFNVPIMDKMGTTVAANMGKDQLKGATESIKDIMQQYVDQGGRFTVAQWKTLPQPEKARLQGNGHDTTPQQQKRVVPAGAIAGRDKNGNIIGYKTADGKVVTF